MLHKDCGVNDQCKLENISAYNTFSDDRRKLLPKSAWMYWFYPPDEHENHERIVVGCYVKGPKRTLSYEVFSLSDLPNGLVNAEDLEAILINLLDRSAIQRFEHLNNCRVGTHAVASDFI
jgi:hypothetical protein